MSTAPVSGGSGTETGGAAALGDPGPTIGGSPALGGAAASGGAVSPSGGSAAALGGGGQGAAGGGVETPGTVDSAEQFEACSDYMMSQCRRRDECGSLEYGQCLGIAIPLCPAFFFAPGAHATLEAIGRCAERWRRASCEELEDPDFPGCPFDPGDRKLGERCSFNAQCEKGRCDRTSSLCGRCAATVGEGEACSPEVAICGGGFSCITSCPLEGGACTSACGKPPPVAVVPAGGDCSGGAECEAGLLCWFTAGEGTCQPQRRIGEACATTAECLEGHCDAAALVCAPVPELGMPCALPARHLGRACAPGSTCDMHVEPPVCVTPGALAETCWPSPNGTTLYDSTCQTDLACACTDPTCSTGARQCSRILAPGDSCAFAGAFCAEPTQCRNGFCEPVLALDPSLETCGP